VAFAHFLFQLRGVERVVEVVSLELMRKPGSSISVSSHGARKFSVLVFWVLAWQITVGRIWYRCLLLQAILCWIVLSPPETVLEPYYVPGSGGTHSQDLYILCRGRGGDCVPVSCWTDEG
jgi:hypothetical protein